MPIGTEKYSEGIGAVQWYNTAPPSGGTTDGSLLSPSPVPVTTPTAPQPVVSPAVQSSLTARQTLQASGVQVVGTSSIQMKAPMVPDFNKGIWKFEEFLNPREARNGFEQVAEYDYRRRVSEEYKGTPVTFRDFAYITVSVPIKPKRNFKYPFLNPNSQETQLSIPRKLKK